MNKRQMQKEETKSLIFTNSEKILLEYGLNKTSMTLISNELNLSQGTLFLHFKSKANLFNTILKSNLDKMKSELIACEDTGKTSLVFFNTLIEVIANNEKVLRLIYKDSQLVPGEISQLINEIENKLKNSILNSVREHSKERVHIVNSFIAIDAFLSQVKMYLIESEVSSNQAPYIFQKKQRLEKLYFLLFGNLK